MHKQVMQTGNFNKPQSHMALYTSAPKKSRVEKSQSKMQQATPPPQHYIKELQGLEGVIDVNECDHLVKAQLKQDRIKRYKGVKCKLNHSMSVILGTDEKADLTIFLYGALFSPVKSTLIKALHNNHITTWPGLDTTLISRHLDKSMYTAKGQFD